MLNSQFLTFMMLYKSMYLKFNTLSTVFLYYKLFAFFSLNHILNEFGRGILLKKSVLIKTE